MCKRKKSSETFSYLLKPTYQKLPGQKATVWGREAGTRIYPVNGILRDELVAMLTVRLKKNLLALEICN